MWNKSERFAISVAIYQKLLRSSSKDVSDSNFEIDWDFINSNCFYQEEEIDINKITTIFNIYQSNSELYLNKVKKYLKSYIATPVLIVAILISLFLEIDSTKAIIGSDSDKLPENFLGKYPRLTQELVAGEHTSLINAIVRKIAVDEKLEFQQDSNNTLTTGGVHQPFLKALSENSDLLKEYNIDEEIINNIEKDIDHLGQQD